VLAAYRVLARLGHRLPAPAALRTTLTARRGAPGRWAAWAHAQPSGHPVVWAHAASVGEQQVLEPIISRLNRAHPDLRIVLSHTSPSVAHTIRPAAVCHRDYLPWDTPGPIVSVLDAVRPSLLLFGRGDLWPELVCAARARGIPIAVAGASVRPGSARLRLPARFALRDVHRAVAWLGAVTPSDADRWRRLGVPPHRIVVTGDPRHDRMLERMADPGPATAIRTWAAGCPVLVAGSVEPEDDAALAHALARLAAAGPDLRAVIVPHEPGDTRIRRIEGGLADHGVTAGIWRGPADGIPPAAPVLIVATHGLLADLYLGADIAYVGGGFRRGRLHAVAEPAAVGLPVIIGPRWQGATDAEPMVTSGGALVLRAADASAALASAIARLASHPEEQSDRGLAARGTLTAGASGITADALLGLLGH
jgi:3-deoxy-D-manno-octulosonic-acid transferase